MKKKVLIVDGEKAFADILKVYLEKFGPMFGDFEVAIAQTTDEVESLLNNKPDIIFWGNKLMLNVWVIDGFLQRKLEIIPKNTLHVAMSSTHHEEQVEIFEGARAKYVLFPKTRIMNEFEDLLGKIKLLT